MGIAIDSVTQQETSRLDRLDLQIASARLLLFSLTGTFPKPTPEPELPDQLMKNLFCHLLNLQFSVGSDPKNIA